MKLKQLLQGLDIERYEGDLNVEISSVAYDSRKVKKGSVFVCKGFDFNERYIADAIENGAAAVVKQKDMEFLVPEGTACIEVKDSRYALAFLSSAFFDNPSKKLRLIGVTGTKGKTTTTYMIKSIIEQSGVKTGLIGTIQNMIGNEIIYTERTTPESYDLQSLFDEMVNMGVETAVMEVSSQGLQYHRVSCCSFETGVFNNISSDHIGPGEHKDFEEYLSAKAMLFKMCKNSVINADSDFAEFIIKSASGEKPLTFGIIRNADIIASDIERYPDGVSFEIKAPWWSGRIKMSSIGTFNIYNALAAIAVCGLHGISFEDIKNGLRDVKVKGRVEVVPTGRNFSVIIDYAHNAVSLESLLLTMKEYARGRVVCLFGCGGDRDPARRFEMGEVSGRLADFTIITSDNPRTEDPSTIIENIETGIKKTDGKYICITDRTEAIKYAVNNAIENDIIVLAGKGHENYQIFKGKTIHYDEREIVESILLNTLV